MKSFSVIVAALALSGVAHAQHHEGRSQYRAPYAAVAPVVDGVPDDAAWARAEWRPLAYNWLGDPAEASDVSGRFKVVWSGNRLYLMAEIVDDILFDAHRDPLVQYWDDDCLEVFIDEDFSGGDHQYNHNAFAYHLSLDNRAIDIGTDRKPRDYTHHVTSHWRQYEDRLVWEVAFDLYDDSYVDGATDNTPVALSAGKIIGLMVAWCDNDGSELRENFVGSELTFEGRTDWGWIDAGLFGELILDE